MSRPAALAAEPVRRLHPLTPVLSGFKAIAALVAALSVQGAMRLGWRGFVGALLVTMCLAVAVSVVSLLVTGYHVVGRELRIHEGVLFRRSRAIPLERLQAVEVVRPLLARIVGLAELRLEVVGGGKTEAPLAYLTVADAAALRRRLLDLAHGTGAAASGADAAPPADGAGDAMAAGGTAAGPVGDATTGAGADAGTAGAVTAGGGPSTAPDGAGPAGRAAAGGADVAATAERHLHTVANQDVLVSQLLTPQVMFLPLGIVFVVAQYWFGEAWSFVAMVSMVVAVIGLLQQPARRILSDWNFRLSVSPAGLRVRHGLTELRSQTVPMHRVQAVTVVWPLLWRRMRWLRCRLHVAGFGVQQLNTSDRLLPVGDLATGRRLVAEVIPGVDLTALPLAPAPRRARWVAPVSGPILAAGLHDHVFVTRDGRLTREITLVPYHRAQSVRLVQGPLQRLLGLASVHVDAAGGLNATARHRDLADARRLAAELTERARAARETDRAARDRPGDDAATPR